MYANDYKGKKLKFYDHAEIKAMIYDKLCNLANMPISHSNLT